MSAITSTIPAVFVFHEGHLKPGGGGVQICSREYLRTLEASGFVLKPVEIKFDHRWSTRFTRKVITNPYKSFFDSNSAVSLLKNAVDQTTQYIFLNQRSLGGLAGLIRQQISQTCKIVVLSHGLESVDFLHKLRIETSTNRDTRSARNKVLLGKLLLDESEQAQHLDHVFCLAPFEVEIERWLGARSVSYLPRTIMSSPLNWRPKPGRIGFVGTVDHPPNAEGLELFLKEIQDIGEKNVRLRLVGGPKAQAELIAKRYPFVDYLGRLSDEELEEEASSWNCAVHPLFRYSRGCSTKLAFPIGWKIPIVTTSMGCRGYVWREGQLPTADTPRALAELALEMLEPDASNRAKEAVSRVAETSPTVNEVSQIIRSSLKL